MNNWNYFLKRLELRYRYFETWLLTQHSKNLHFLIWGRRPVWITAIRWRRSIPPGRSRILLRPPPAFSIKRYLPLIFTHEQKLVFYEFVKSGREFLHLGLPGSVTALAGANERRWCGKFFFFDRPVEPTRWIAQSKVAQQSFSGWNERFCAALTTRLRYRAAPRGRTNGRARGSLPPRGDPQLAPCVWKIAQFLRKIHGKI